MATNGQKGMAGMARAYQYAHFFLIFFLPSHTVTAQMARRDSLLPLNYSLTDCVHSSQQGEVILPSWCFFLHLTQQGEDDLPSHPVFSRLSRLTKRGGYPPFSCTCKGNPLTLRTPSHTERLHLLNSCAHRTPALAEHLHSSNAHAHRTPMLTGRSPDRMPTHP